MNTRPGHGHTGERGERDRNSEIRTERVNALGGNIIWSRVLRVLRQVELYLPAM